MGIVGYIFREDDREVIGKRLCIDVGSFEDGLVEVPVFTVEKVLKKKGRPRGHLNKPA